MTYLQTITLAEQHRHDLIADAAAARSARRLRVARRGDAHRWFTRRRHAT